MTSFAAFFLLELKQLKSKRNAIILIILWLFLLGLVYDGIVKYEKLIDREQKFVEIEALNMKKFPNYDVYGDEGISVQYCPGPIGIFFDSIGVSPDLIGKIDSLVNISIFDNYKGKSLFRGIFADIWSFAGILFFFGSLLCLFWGTHWIGNKEYQKFLSGTFSKAKVYFSVIFSRLIIMTLILLVFAVSAFILLLIKNIEIPAADFNKLLQYFLSTLLLLFFFFLCGVAIGIIQARKNRSSVPAVLITWIIFVLLIPGIVQKITENKASCSIIDYQTEIEKFKTVSEFEKRANEEYGSKYDGKEVDLARKIMESYFNEEYPKIQALEKKLKDGLDDNIYRFNCLSLLTPSTIYYLNSMEVSSRGYESFKSFYSYLMELKRQFVRFYIDRYYYNDPKVMVNFIKNGENLFHAESRLPGNFWIGMLISLGYIVILLVGSFFLFTRYLHKMTSEDLKKLGDVDLEMGNGKLYSWLFLEDHFGNLIYNLFSGNYEHLKDIGFTGKVKINGVDIAAEKNPEDFVYISRLDSFPGDLKVKNFIYFYARMMKIPKEKIRTLLGDAKLKTLAKKSFAGISKKEKFDLLLSLLNIGEEHIYIIDDIATGLLPELAIDLKDCMDGLAQKGSLMIYLTSTMSSEKKLGLVNKYYDEGTAWDYWCEALRIEINHLKSEEEGKK